MPRLHLDIPLDEMTTAKGDVSPQQQLSISLLTLIAEKLSGQFSLLTARWE